jgi:type IX secretion system PorP/SprF family membrane protein
MDGAPATNAFLAHSPLRLRSLGLGLSVVEDRIGPSRTGSFFADFAYRIRVTRESRLAFGLKAGGTTMRLNLSEVSGTDLNDPVYQRNLSSGFQPNFGFGLYYWSHKGYIGLSAPKLLNASVTGSDENGVVTVYDQAMHGFLTAGYVFQLSHDLKLRPAMLLKAVMGAPASADLSANFLFREKLWAGLAYRTSNDVATILSYQLSEQLRAGYAYDLSLSPLRTRTSGSHELMVSYDLLFSKRMLRSPRYF